IEPLHCLNKLEVLLIWYCNFDLHLRFIKSEAREREARENGASVTHSGSTGKVSGPVKVSERNDKKFGPTKSVEPNHQAKQECHHEGI
ncbi:10673_t:CDS:2, partial [Funneliformis geosporum]